MVIQNFVSLNLVIFKLSVDEKEKDISQHMFKCGRLYLSILF